MPQWYCGKSSPGVWLENFLGFFGLELGEEDALPDGGLVGEEHGQQVYAHAQAPGGGHAILQGLEEVLVGELSFLIPPGPELLLLPEALPLLQGVIELGEGVSYLHPSAEGLKALHQPGLPRFPLGQWGHLPGVVQYKGRLDKAGLPVAGEESVNKLTPVGGLPRPYREKAPFLHGPLQGA